MSLPVHEIHPTANYHVASWISHEFNRILRQARNLRDAGKSDTDILDFIFEEKKTLDEENEKSYAKWDKIAEFVAGNKEEEYVSWVRENNVPSRWDDLDDANARERFRIWRRLSDEVRERQEKSTNMVRGILARMRR